MSYNDDVSPGPASKFNVVQDLDKLLQSHESLEERFSKQGLILAEHQGNLKGIFPAISAVQSSLGAWLAVVGVVTTALVGLAIFNLTRTNAVGDQVAAQSQRIGGLEVRLGGVENRLAVLPEEVAHEVAAQQSSRPSNRSRK
jgi:hypothetical protein